MTVTKFLFNALKIVIQLTFYISISVGTVLTGFLFLPELQIHETLSLMMFGALMSMIVHQLIHHEDNDTILF